MRYVLVTGAQGFIGSVLCESLRKRGIRVRTLNHRSPPETADSYQMDLAIDDCPAGLCDGIDTVFHLAGKAHAVAESPQLQQYKLINTDGTRKLLEAAKQAGVKRFVFFSSVMAVGNSEPLPMDETAAEQADGCYGQSKYEAEQLVLHGGYIPHPVVIRPCMVYGETRKGNLPRMINAMRRGVFPPLPETQNRRSMVHVNDVVTAALLAAEKSEAAGQIYIVSDGQQYSTRQLYDWIRAAIGKPAISWAIPYCLFALLANIGDLIGAMIGRRFPFDTTALGKLTGSAWYSSAKIERELGFRPQYNLKQSLPAIVRYLNS